VPKSRRSEETGAQRLSSLRQKRGNKKNITRPQYFLKETGERLLKSGEGKIIVRPASLVAPKSRRSEGTGERPP
jgi:hypothetical protein